jgi:subtilisin-like proprotein convertase family protein
MKTRFLLLIVVVFSFWNSSNAQIGIGTANPQAALDITSSTNGVLIPRVTLTALGTYAPVVNPSTSLAPVTGTLVWNDGVSLSPAGFYYWSGSTWTALGGGSSSGVKWDLSGNVVGAAGSSFLGSTDNNPVRFRTNNLDRFEISNTGFLRSFNDGTAALPAYSWNSDPAMGLFRQGTNIMGVTTGGLERLRFTNSYQIYAVSTTTNVGSALAPFYSFYNNAGAGMWSPQAGKLAFSTNSAERLRIDNTGYVGIGSTFATTAPEAMLDIRSTNKGILIPRVALTSILVATILTPKDSELVYNTATAGTAPNDVTPGFYYWTIAPAKWNKVGGSVDVKSGTASATATLVEPTNTIPNIFASGGSNTSAVSIPSNTTDTRTISVTGFVGNTTAVKCNVKFNHAFLSEADIYLQSPTGQIIELMTDITSGFGTTNDIVFDDTAATNVTSAGGASIVGTYRPEGTLTVDVITPNITTMAGFNGVSPNGLWTLHMRDDTTADNFDFNSFSLDFSTTATPLQYRLVGETSITYKTGTNLIVNSMYSANPNDDGGFVTALTRTAASAGAIGTLVSSLPSTVISYASDSPKQGAGNYWATTYNQAVPSGLVSGTTYFFQLWAKGNIPTPFSSNEIFSLIPMIIPQ